MADSKRMSGRQGAPQPSGTSGRSVATSTSGRHPPQNGTSPASKSSRSKLAPATPSAKSTRTGIPPASRRTTHISARGAARPMSTSGRQPIGGPAAKGKAGAPKKKQRGGPELLIAFGVISAMGLLALVLYVVRSNQQRDVTQVVEKENETYEKNLKRAKDACQVAYNAGLNYVKGKEDPALPEDKLREKLFGTLQRDPNIYNVIYIRSYKDRHSKQRTEQKQMNDDRLRFEKMESVGREEDGIRLTYALTENKTQPVVMAAKNEHGDETDKANLGGSITVIVKADMDKKFEGGMKFKPPPAEPKAPPPADTGEKK